MTRKEWVEQNYPNSIGKNFIAGVLGCPYKYQELCQLDPAIRETMICPGVHVRATSDEVVNCITCWGTPLPEKEGKPPSDKPEIRKTMGEPHIKDVFYTIVRYPIGNYWLYTVGEFSITSMSMINDRRAKCVAFDYDLQYEYTFFYDLTNRSISFTPDIEHQAKKTPNLDRSLFLERSDAVDALEKWRGNIGDRTYYVLVKKGDQK